MNPADGLSETSMRQQVSAQEWQARVDLAACYRLVAHFGWSDLVFTHITARVPGAQGQFLINPYGMMFEEITASSLVKIDQSGNKLDDTPHMVNPAGFLIHSAVHSVRHDAQCVLHAHSLNGVAVSAQKGGVLPLSQQSMFVLSSLAYHDYEGVALNEGEKARLVADLGDKTFFMLRNHGLLTVGPTIADAFLSMYLFEAACTIQIRAQSGGGPLVPVPDALVATAQQQASTVTKSLGARLVWPGLLRMLDRRDASYRE
ncbi:class II aldolase/adducin family protein [Algiphilus sp. W345]|uniref:Class II aldolase/adducin family protein n=1 Tax=Banduia mediterranea TaxID=3075609 RepID=A0ABU2WIN5_9GAMM|nr:class II aldolase/adducin family protein [Algiphilus sp. W345]MDT0497733.1 class II aldolase/adducin family protein [Algiphilus sp. W345]